MLHASPPVVNVSHARGDQAETAVAADQRLPRILVAASVSIDLARLGHGPVWTTPTYASTDGGASWTAAGAPPPPAGVPARCAAQSDPALAIRPDGTELDAFVSDVSCAGRRLVFVARRSGPDARWRTAPAPAVPDAGGPRQDDRPALAVDRASGRVYLAFQEGEGVDRPLLLVRSDDGGATWTPPRRIGTGSFAALATGAGGALHLAYATSTEVVVAASRDGGAAFARRRFPIRSARLRPPAQARRGLGTVPGIAETGGRVLVTWEDARGAAVAVRIAVLDARLRVLAPPRALAPSAILPAVAADPGGTFWDCFAATRGALLAETCAWSRDGIRWRRARVSPWFRAPATPFQLGDYAAVAPAGGAAHPVWAGPGRGTDVYTARVWSTLGR